MRFKYKGKSDEVQGIVFIRDLFDIHRNEETIDWIRQEADGYDRELNTLSDSLMQEKLKVEQIKK